MGANSKNRNLIEQAVYTCELAQEAFIDDQVNARNYTMKILRRGGAKRNVVESV